MVDADSIPLESESASTIIATFFFEEKLFFGIMLIRAFS